MTTNTTSTASQAPAVSIDSSEFRQLAANWVRAEHYAHPTPSPKVEAFRALIAHIDAQMVKDHNRGYTAGYTAMEARATTAEAKLEAMRQGVNSLVGYGDEHGTFVSRAHVLALLQPQHQADESGFPG